MKPLKLFIIFALCIFPLEMYAIPLGETYPVNSNSYIFNADAFVAKDKKAIADKRTNLLWLDFGVDRNEISSSIVDWRAPTEEEVIYLMEGLFGPLENSGPGMYIFTTEPGATLETPYFNLAFKLWGHTSDTGPRIIHGEERTVSRDIHAHGTFVRPDGTPGFVAFSEGVDYWMSERLNSDAYISMNDTDNPATWGGPNYNISEKLYVASYVNEPSTMMLAILLLALLAQRNLKSPGFCTHPVNRIS